MWLSKAEKPEHVGPQGTERSPGSVILLRRGRGPGKGRNSLTSLREFFMVLELLQRKRCPFITLTYHPFSTEEALESQTGVQVIQRHPGR